MVAAGMTRLDSIAVPQADDLDKVRSVVAAVDRGFTETAAIADRTGFSRRHVEYRLRAARGLGMVSEGEVTPEGKALLATETQSEEERLAWRSALARCLTLATLAPDLFALRAPTRDELASRIVACTAMAQSTAHRRAGTLLAWRRRLASRQLDLFGGL